VTAASSLPFGMGPDPRQQLQASMEEIEIVSHAIAESDARHWNTSTSWKIGNMLERIASRMGAAIETLEKWTPPAAEVPPTEALEALYMAAAILGEEDGHPPVPAQTAYSASVAVQVAIQSLGGDALTVSPERVRAYIAASPQDPPDVSIPHVTKAPKKRRAAGGGNRQPSKKAAKR
jgi:hypothetical protein